MTVIATASPNLNGKAEQNWQADSLGAGVALLLATTVLQRLVGFGRGMLFCRWLPPESLGEWDMAYGFLLTAAPLAVWGVPGAFGRYAEHYRQQGQLLPFLRRTAWWTAVWGTAAVGAGLVASAPLAEAVFGSRELAGLMTATVVCLASVILSHTLTSLLTGLRLYRAVSALTFVQGMTFAAVALGLLWRTPTATTAVVGYAASCVAASGVALAWLWPRVRTIGASAAPLPHGAFWNKLLRFAFFVWLVNALTNLFAVMDRYMLIHFGGFSAAEALVQVGYYHSSRVVPLLLTSVADLVAGMVLPQLSYAWETGRRREAGERCAATVKLTAAGMLAAGVAILALAPPLFHHVLSGKYDGGLAVLPATLAGCVWFGLSVVAQNYLWCAERARLSVLPIAAGLALNGLLNLWLVPQFGLQGAAVATAAAAAAVLGLLLLLSQRLGMPIDAGLILLTLSPLALASGVVASAATLLAMVWLGARTELLFAAEERASAITLANERIRSLLDRLHRRDAPASVAG